MHFSLLIGYGAGAVCPYLAFELLHELAEQEVTPLPVDAYTAEKNFVKAINKGVLKVMSKMGISTVQSYRGAQIFEAVGLNQETIDQYFTWTSSRIGGIGLDTVEEETRRRHAYGYADGHLSGELEIDQGGAYYWRRNGEYHMYNPESIALLQHSTGSNRLPNLQALRPR